MRYLVDTNACLDFTLRRNERLISKMGKMFGELTVSTVTVAELRVGAKDTTDPVKDDRLLDVFLANVEVRPFDEEAASAYGAMIRRIGMRRGSFDRLIAAHALAIGAIVVTNNTRDFSDVPGLIVENWAQ